MCFGDTARVPLRHGRRPAADQRHHGGDHEQHDRHEEDDLGDVDGEVAIPPKPRTAATSATSRNVTAQPSMTKLLVDWRGAEAPHPLQPTSVRRIRSRVPERARGTRIGLPAFARQVATHAGSQPKCPNHRSASATAQIHASQPLGQAAADPHRHCDPPPIPNRAGSPGSRTASRDWSGKPATFLIALALIVVWAVTGRCSASATPGNSWSTPRPRS